MYLDYSTYQTMGGDLDNSAFIVYERKAERLIDSQAGGKTGLRIKKLSELPQEVVDCTFDLIAYFVAHTETVASESQSLGGQSESKTYLAKDEVDEGANKIIEMYLLGIKVGGYSVIYKGVSPWDMSHSAETDEKLDIMSKAKKLFSNALIGTKTGRAVRVDDISPLKRTVDIDVDSDEVSPSTFDVYEYGKNLLPTHPVEETEIAGVNINVNADGTIQVKGKATRQVRFTVAKEVEMLRGQQYTLSSGYDTLSWGLDIFFYKGSTQREVWQNLGSNTSGYVTSVFPDDIGTMNVLINISEGAEVDHTLKLQVEAENKVTKYEKYKKPILHRPTEYGKLSDINVEESATFVVYQTDVLLTVKYNRDINKAFAELEEKLTNAILASGGNV